MSAAGCWRDCLVRAPVHIDLGGVERKLVSQLRMRALSLESDHPQMSFRARVRAYGDRNGRRRN